MQDGQLWLEGTDPSEEKYRAFTDKFKPKKTTDDCYTPEAVYNVVEKYVRERYGLREATFARPFYPGGDYKRFDYPQGAVVVDNPPFSIFKQILAFYREQGIRFFLFAPALMLGTPYKEQCTIIATGASVIYENGATVSTSFVTNLEPRVAIRSDPRLHDEVEKASSKNAKSCKKHYDKYRYDDHIITAARVQYLSVHNTPFTLEREGTAFVSKLDSQRAGGKAIFGGGLIVSDAAAEEYAAAERAAAERAAAERAAAICWKLSEREEEVIRRLSSSES